MANLLDALSFWLFLAGAAAFVTTCAIAVAHRISGEGKSLWDAGFFRILVAVTVVSTGTALISGQFLKSMARQEVRAMLTDTKPKKVIIYANGRAIVQGPEFISVLDNLDVNWSGSGRFGRSEYEMAIVSDSSITRFVLWQNSTDSTIYQLNYPKYNGTGSNGIGFIKAEHILLK